MIKLLLFTFQVSVVFGMNSGGSFGELRLDYVVQEIDILEEATQDNVTVYDYYNSPRMSKTLPMAGTSWDVKTQKEPLKVCQRFM